MLALALFLLALGFCLWLAHGEKEADRQERERRAQANPFAYEENWTWPPRGPAGVEDAR